MEHLTEFEKQVLNCENLEDMEVPLALQDDNELLNKNLEREEAENLEFQAKVEANNYLEGLISSTKKEAIKQLIDEYRANKCDHCFFMRYLENLQENPDLVHTE
ncbi:unnamed protein product [Moneuplotes crassus]|uniref:Uncharacterized protein n=1 Tax=Euplotes crassus TaxID=5936 RepID=A0AAD1Y341_EUPCR|nr:unnamed protein product [Moneuplotes crassus]